MLLEKPTEDTRREHPLSAIGRDLQALILFNPKAGSVTEADRDKLIEAAASSGITRYALVGAEMMSDRLFERAKNFDVIIVLGGDGTAKTVAERAPDDAPPLILLPGGTLNVLPRALYGDLAWPEALAAALSRGQVTRLAGGCANDKRFFVAAMFGSPTLLARAREAVREGHLIKAVSRARHFLKRSFSHRLRARAEKARFTSAEGIGVLCPSFSGSVNGEDLEWVKLTASHLIDLARVSIRALGQGWRNDSSVEITRCKRGEIRGHGFIPAVLDGEPTSFLSPIRILYDGKGPRVLALAPDET